MATSPRPYQNNNYIKNASSRDLSKQGKNMLLAKDMEKEAFERRKSWVTFYRNNISFFVIHYMGVKLFPYQRYWLELINRSTNFLGIASRASAKSWLIAVYAIAKCILYPSTIVALNSATKAQAGLIISEKCKSLYDEHPNIARECSGIVTNSNKWEMTFHNGSRINVVISGENGRGHRSTVCVLEERRLIPTEIINSVIRPFLVSRSPGFMKNPKYQHVPLEEPQEIIISSAYYKIHEWYAEAKKLIRMIANGDKDVKAIFLDYLISLRHGIKTKKQLEKEKEKMDSIIWSQEYCNIPYSSSSSSFYKVGFFNRNVKIAWRPKKDDTVKKNPYDIHRKQGEIRLMACDVAMRAGASNDNTIIICARLFPTSKGWLTEICYIESHNGKNALLQVLRLKQLWDEFSGYTPGDIFILDVQNAGLPLYDALTTITKDEARGKEYDAMMVMRHAGIEDKVYEELKTRSLTPNAKECIFPISGTAALNSQISVSLRDRLKKKLLTFLVDDNSEEEFLIKTGNKDILDQDDLDMRAYLLAPMIQTTLMINESIALEMSVVGGNIKLQEPSGARKDRSVCLAYLNHVCGIKDAELLKEEGDSNDFEIFAGLTQFY